MTHVLGDTTEELQLNYETTMVAQDADGNNTVLAQAAVLPAGWHKYDFFRRGHVTVEDLSTGTLLTFDAASDTVLSAADRWGGSILVTILEFRGSGMPSIQWQAYVTFTKDGLDAYFEGVKTPFIDTITATVEVDEASGVFTIDVTPDEDPFSVDGTYFVIAKGEIYHED